MIEVKKTQEWESIRREFVAHVSKCGLRFTKQRELVLRAVFVAGTHVDAETILAQAKSQDPAIGFATVYRTLQLLTASGLLAERNFGGERRRFELVGAGCKHHDHLICTDCGAVLEFFDPEVEELQERIAKKLGFALTGHRMDLYGNCVRGEKCPRKKAKEKGKR